MDDFSANIAAVSTGVSMGALGAGELPAPQVDNPYLADMSEEALRERLSEAFLRQMYGQMADDAHTKGDGRPRPSVPFS